MLAQVARRWSAWNAQVRERPVRPTLSEADLVTRLAAYDFEQPHSLDEMVEDVADLLEQGSLHATHPRYFGLFVPGVREAGVAGDALAAVYNPQLGCLVARPRRRAHRAPDAGVLPRPDRLARIGLRLLHHRWLRGEPDRRAGGAGRHVPTTSRGGRRRRAARVLCVRPGP